MSYQKEIKKEQGKIKILIATHKPAIFPKGECFVPIHVGRDVAMEASKDGKISKNAFEWLIKNTIGDNTGDNISIKNRYYNEISALFWAWKNYDKLGNPDYIGLMHYRRHFVFNEQYWKKKEAKESVINQGLCVIREKLVSRSYLKRIGLEPRLIKDACLNSDVVLSYPTRLSYAFNEKRNIRSDYAKIAGMNLEDFDLMIDLIKRKYPNCIDELDKFVKGDNKYIYQMFIMKKELFFEYCEFLFGILFEIEKQRNYDNYTINGKRTLGYLGEIMLSIFFIIKEDKNLKLKHTGITLILNDSKKDYWKGKLKKIIQSIFSIKNEEHYKILTILGLKTKIKKL